ncbi:MAG: hypothetical protein ABMA02_13250 [Saprospiraceae bacterium]
MGEILLNPYFIRISTFARPLPQSYPFGNNAGLSETIYDLQAYRA